MKVILPGKVMLSINSTMLTTKHFLLEKPGNKFNGLMLKMVRLLFFYDHLLEHFIVWMRTAGLPNFRKLWGRINETLQPGNYTINIVNNYDVSSF